MKPTDLDISAMQPLRDTFPHSDLDLAAAILVAALQDTTDAWGPVSPAQLSESAARFSSDLRRIGYTRVFSSTRALFEKLAEGGFAVVEDQAGGVSFSDLGLRQLDKSCWRRQPSQKDLFDG